MLSHVCIMLHAGQDTLGHRALYPFSSTAHHGGHDGRQCVLGTYLHFK